MTTAELPPAIMRAARRALSAEGGKRRAAKLSKKRLSEIGRQGARAMRQGQAHGSQAMTASLDGIHHFNPSYDFADMPKQHNALLRAVADPPKAKRQRGAPRHRHEAAPRARAVALTGQRRGDVVKMGRQHIRNGALTVKQEKTGKLLVIPVHPHLQAVLDATPSEHLTFLVTAAGTPYSGNHFSASFREWCDAAGLPKRCSAHGLRKAKCRLLAEAGCSANEIASISGHVSLDEVARYTRAADQARLARNAMNRSQNLGGNAASTPARR